ncbi:DUF4180 domain-containing protein [Paenibacillus gansuensis]|uniref:DUF4180 domain-containing protein n=1 Tax=Paenibacillus gansuensis TaxID=306542 RepID=A0ABW5PA34_9BACL
MQITKTELNGHDIAIISGSEIIIHDVQSALDFMATVRYEAGCDRIVIGADLISPDFFDLKTRLAGEILQKFINYQVKLAIIGDFSGYDSQSLRDFIYESNNGQNFFFVPDEQQALEKLGAAGRI